MTQKFTGKSGFVTGASSGIGLAVAGLLDRSGATPLALFDRVEPVLHEACGHIRGAQLIAGHVADEVMWADAAPLLDGLDLAVVNAGVTSSGPIDTLDFTEWRRVMSTNLDGAFLSIRAAMRAMKRHGRGGAIVVTASASGLKAEAGIAAYGASKAALLHLTRIAAKEGAAHGIRVNAIAPGGVKTPIWQQAEFFRNLVQTSGSADAAFADMANAATPLGRFATADEIAAQIAFLLSDDAATITGATLTSDGGYSA